MADWKKYVNNVHPIHNDKINFIDPNDLMTTMSVDENGNRVMDMVEDDSRESLHPINCTWSQDDFCIDVDIMMEVSSRNDFATSTNDIYYLSWNSKDGKISMMSGQRFYFGQNTIKQNAELREKMIKGDKTEDRQFTNFHSTIDYDANYQDVMRGYISTEALGIENIDISYTQAFCPQVVIKMRDVRGKGMMMAMERNHTKSDAQSGMGGYARNDIADSFYSALMQLPYPKVTMKVKGFYGAPTTYDLTFQNIENSFNANDGCNNITLTLIGYCYSFLTEVPVLHAMLAPYMEYNGAAYWDSIGNDERYLIDGQKPTAWIDIVKNVTKVKTQVDNFAANGIGEFGLVKQNDNIKNDANDLVKIAQNLYTALQSYFNSSQSDGGCGYSVGTYANEGGSQAYQVLAFTDPNSDFNILNCSGTVTDWSTGNFAKTSELAKDNIKNIVASLATDWNTLNSLASGEDFKDVKNVLDGFSLVFISTAKLRGVGTWMNGAYSDLMLASEYYGDLGLSGADQIPNQPFVASDNYTKNIEPFVDIAFFTVGVKKDNVVYSLPKYVEKIVAAANNQQKALEKKAKKAAVDAVNSSITFRPTLKNVMKLLVEHCETFFDSVYKVSSQVGDMTNGGKRNATSAGLDTKNSDIMNENIPPFPAIYEKQNDRLAQSWAGTQDYNVFQPETDFTNALVNAAERGVSEINEVAATGEDSNSNINSITTDGIYDSFLGIIPITDIDVMVGKSPFQYVGQSALDSIANDGNWSELLSVLFMRFVTIAGYYNAAAGTWETEAKINYSDAGTADAWNFWYQFSGSVTLNDALMSKMSNALLSNSFDVINMTNGHVDMNLEKPCLDNYWQTTVGMVSGTPMQSQMYTVSNSEAGVNNFKMSVNYYNNVQNSGVSQLTVFENEQLFKTLTASTAQTVADFGVINSNGDYNAYHAFKNYVVIDPQCTALKGGSLQALATNAEKLDIDYTTFASSKYVVNSTKTDRALVLNVATPDETNDILCNPSFKMLNPSTGLSFDKENSAQFGFFGLTPSSNLFINPSYYGNYARTEDGILDANGTMIHRAAMFLIFPRHNENGELVSSYTDSADGKTRTITIETNLQKVSNKFISEMIVSNIYALQFGAMCWAHLFCDDVLYVTEDKYNLYFNSTVSYGQKTVVKNRFIQTEGQSDSWGYADQLVIQYTFALYFLQWVSHTYMDYASKCEFDVDKLEKNPLSYLSDDSSRPSGLEKDGDSIIFSSSMAEQMQKDLFSPCEVLLNRNRAVSNDNLSNFYLYSLALLTELNSIYNSNKEVEFDKQRENDATKVAQVEESDKPIDPKISVYWSTKRLWDKWLCGAKQRVNGNFVSKNWLNIDFFDKRFHFIDTFYNDIGDEVLIDLNILVDTFIEAVNQRQNWSLMTYIDYVLGKSRIQFHNLQNWADLSKTESMAKAFVPMSWNEAHNMNSSSDPNSELDNSATNTDFVCIYSYEPSHLMADVSETSGFKDDGFSLYKNETDNLNLPTYLGQNMAEDTHIPAFAVEYGRQYQSYFTNINFSVNKNVQTEWGIMATLKIAQMGSDKLSDQTQFIGQDLYTVQSNQSFACSVDMLGCAWIQPLMYFCVTNVPLYRGTYMISKVNHSISPGKMTTHFEGVKISRFANRIVDAGAFNGFGAGSSSSSPSAENRAAKIDNDCDYKKFNPVSLTDENKSYEYTTNPTALKAYCPPYIKNLGYSSVWDAIMGTMKREVGEQTSSEMDILWLKYSYLTMFSNHAYGCKHSKDGWKYVFTSACYRSKDHPHSTNSKCSQIMAEVFENPCKAILGNAASVNQPLTRGLNLHRHHYVGSSIKPYMDDAHKFEFLDLPIYDNKQKTGKKIGDVTTVTKKMLQMTNQYSTYYEYADGKINGVGTFVGGHYESKGLFGVTFSNARVSFFENGSHGEQFFDDDMVAKMWQMPDGGTSSNESEDCKFLKTFVDAVQKTVNTVASMNCDKVEIIAQLNNSGCALISCKNKNNNAQLFDILTRKSGYFGYCKAVTWITHSKSTENPEAIYISCTKATDSVTPKFYFFIEADALPTSLTQELCNKYTASNMVTQEQKGRDLKDIPANFWSIFSKNTTMTDNAADNTSLFAFSYCFGGTTYINDRVNWGGTEAKNDTQITYYIKKYKPRSCSEDVEAASASSQVLSEANLSYQEFFKEHPNSIKAGDKWKERTLRCTTSNKLKKGQFKGPVESIQKLTSPYGKRSYPPEGGGMHYGIDFARNGGGGYAIAGYDGRVVCIFEGAGYGTIICVAYNIQNADGQMLVCGYAHHDKKDVCVSVGQWVSAGDRLGKLNRKGVSYSTGIHCHLLANWYPKMATFKWYGRYGGPRQDVLLGKNSIDLSQYIEFEGVRKR